MAGAKQVSCLSQRLSWFRSHKCQGSSPREGFLSIHDELGPSWGRGFALCPLPFFIIWVFLQTNQSRVVKVLNECSWAGWGSGDWTVDFCSQTQLRPERDISKEDQQGSQQPEQIDYLSWILDGVCFGPWDCSAIWSPESPHVASRWCPRLVFCSWSYDEGISSHTWTNHTVAWRPRVYETDVKGWGIQSIRKRKISFAPQNTSVNQSHNQLS